MSDDFHLINDETEDGDNWDEWDQDEFEDSMYSLFWVTQDREVIRIPDMNTHHIFFAIRMIFNHTVPKEHATGPHRRYNLQNHGAQIRRFVLIAMLQELIRRPDRPKWMDDELGHMADTVNHLLNGRMPPLKLRPSKKVKFDDL